MPSAIADPVDIKNPAWAGLVESVLKAGNVKHLRGVVPEGLPPGGYWEYRKRVDKGRVYLMYNIRATSKAYTIASVDPEFAQEALLWKPTPNTSRLFRFPSGAVEVHYDEQALPARIYAVPPPRKEPPP